MTKLSKLQIATLQLNTAIALYLKGEDLVSAITLAGAAEEILGKLAVSAGARSAFDEALDRLCGMYEAAFNEKPDRKAFVDLRTRARNEFKHIGLHPDIDVDLEREAVSILRRAIENYRKHDSSFRELFQKFQQELLNREEHAPIRSESHGRAQLDFRATKVRFWPIALVHRTRTEHPSVTVACEAARPMAVIYHSSGSFLGRTS